MGTKVEGKSYLPGYFAMADFSMNSSGSWFQHYEEKKRNGPLYDGFMIMSTNGSSEYDKEMLKRTMLVHEATFRRQVYELHRLYKIQKDLMSQFIQKERCNGYSGPLDTLQSKSFAYHVPSGDTKSIWQMPHLSNSYDRSPNSLCDDKLLSLNFMKEGSSQFSRNGDPSRFKSDKSTKKMLDLQLPADVYADNDDVEMLEKKTVVTPSIKPDGSFFRTDGVRGDVKLTLGTVEGSSFGENRWITDLQSQNNRCGYTMSDLNKPITEPCHGGTSDTKLTDFLGVGASGGQNQHYSSRQVNNFQGLGSEFKDRYVGETSGSNLFGGNEEARHHSLFSNKENDRNISMAWFRQKSNGIETYTAPQPVLASPASFVTRAAPWDANNRNNLNDNYDLALEAIGARNWNRNADPGTGTRSAIGAHSSLNDFCNGFSLDSIRRRQPPHLSKISSECLGSSNSAFRHHLSGQCPKGVNLNQVPSDRIQDGSATLHDRAIDGIENGCENPPVQISWLRKKAACDELTDLKSQTALSSANGHSQIMFSSGMAAQQSESHGSRRNDGSEAVATRILRFPISDANGKGSLYSCIPHIEQSLTASRRKSEGDSMGYAAESSAAHDACEERQIQGTKVDKIIRNHIDLNDELPCMDLNDELPCMDASELPHENQEMVPLPPDILPSNGAKLSSVIDICWSKGNVVSLGRCTPLRKSENSHNSLAITAAENLMAMFKDAHSNVDSASCPAISPPQLDTLHWFAELATSRGNGDCAPGNSDDEEMDFFEAMTLKLEETKGYEYSCRPTTLEHKNDDKRTAASLLLKRPRRGQARRRRQKRDFQKDILPGLASLSRHEVTEDLQTLGGLMKASGKSMPLTPTRRGGRNRSQGKGRRRPRNLSVAVEEVQVSPLPVPLPTADLDTDRRSIMVWGRTTRRCRRPRCPPASAAVHLA